MSVTSETHASAQVYAAQQFFCDFYAVFQNASQRAGMVERQYAIGDFVVRLQFAGDSLLPFIAPAFAHLAHAAQQADPDLTICLWDSHSTGILMPPRPWGREDSLAHGFVRGYNDERFQTALSGDTGALSMLDSHKHLALWWVRASNHIPAYERGAPLRAILHWWMRQHGRLLVHAAAIGNPHGGLLLAGKGGSGKSTTALASVLQGWHYLADDYCLLSTSGDLRAYSVYNTAKLEATHLGNFQSLQPAVSNVSEQPREKALLYLHAHHSIRMLDAVPISAILLPHVAQSTETLLTPVSPAAALQALAPSSLFQLPGTGRDEALALAGFVRKLPCYRLELGSDLSQIPAALAQALAG